MTLSPSATGALCPVLALLLSATALTGQCSLEWLATGPSNGPNDAVYATIPFDPDGAGPLPQHIALAGRFTVAGDATSARVAAYEPTTRTWLGLGAGLDGTVRALATLPNGDLVAGGSFTGSAGQPLQNIARWDGTSWLPLGAGVDGDVRALAVMANGDLIAGGSFGVAGTSPASRVARWNGSAWSPLGAGVTVPFGVPQVYALLVQSNGDLVVGGRFTQAGGVAADNVARWDGVAWSAMGAGGSGPTTSGAEVLALVELPTGALVAAGYFATGVESWNGTGWSPFGSGLAASVSALAVLPNGTLLAGGGGIWSFTGGSWTIFGNQTSVIHCLLPLANGELLACGSFSQGVGQVSRYAQRFDGVNWSDLTAGLDNGVEALAPLPGGDVIVGGHFTARGIGADRVARWDGSAFTPLGAGLDGSVYALAVLPNGHVVAGGTFATSGGAIANRLARFDGTSWAAINGGCNGQVCALLVMQNGDLIATGAFTQVSGAPMARIARWNGSVWQPLGSGLTSTFPLATGNALAELPNGDLVVGGSFDTAGGVATNGVARWDGSQWSALGTAPTSVQSLAVLPNGDLVAGGAFSIVGGAPIRCVARWDGTTWHPFGTGTDNTVLGMVVLPDGDLLVTGLFQTAGNTPARRIARWDGASWSAVGAGLGPFGAGIGTSVVRRAGDEILVGGSFLSAGDVGTAYVARLASTCPATATAVGAGCTGAGGPNALAATSLPWIGGTCTLRATGMPAGGLAIGVRGLGSASLPLAWILPQGLPGCTLLVTPDLLGLHVPIGGVASESFAVPASVTLAGVTLREQFVGIEIDALGAITAVTSSNALVLTLGVF